MTFIFRKASTRTTRSDIYFSSFTVQQKCIPQAILGQDVLCQAKSGLGKTAVFVLVSLQQIEPVAGECAVLVMCHTRELAYQIRNEYNRFSKYIPEIKTSVFYGGTPMQKDVELLSSKETHPHVIVGTPGRLNALVREKKLRLAHVKVFVLDECDKMLEQIGESRFLLSSCPLIVVIRHASRCPGDLQEYADSETGHVLLRYSVY